MGLLLTLYMRKYNIHSQNDKCLKCVFLSISNMKVMEEELNIKRCFNSGYKHHISRMFCHSFKFLSLTGFMPQVMANTTFTSQLNSTPSLFILHEAQ